VKLADHGAEIALMHGRRPVYLDLRSSPVHQEHRILLSGACPDNLDQGRPLFCVALSNFVFGEQFQQSINLTDGLQKFGGTVTHQIPFPVRRNWVELK
jgi:hypothetical protein